MTYERMLSEVGLEDGAASRPMMRRRLLVVLALAVAGLVPIAPARADELARGKQVYDGDPLLVGDGRGARLLGITAPKSREPFHLKAKRFNESLVQGREIRL